MKRLYIIAVLAAYTTLTSTSEVPSLGNIERKKSLTTLACIVRAQSSSRLVQPPRETPVPTTPRTLRASNRSTSPEEQFTKTFIYNPKKDCLPDSDYKLISNLFCLVFDVNNITGIVPEQIRTNEAFFKAVSLARALHMQHELLYTQFGPEPMYTKSSSAHNETLNKRRMQIEDLRSKINIWNELQTSKTDLNTITLEVDTILETINSSTDLAAIKSKRESLLNNTIEILNKLIKKLEKLHQPINQDKEQPKAINTQTYNFDDLNGKIVAEPL